MGRTAERAEVICLLEIVFIAIAAPATESRL